MCKLFDEWSNEIQDYCVNNGLDFASAQRAGKCWGKDFLMLQHVDLSSGAEGLRNETPAPVVLIVKKDHNKLTFQQTEHTRKYLAQ